MGNDVKIWKGKSGGGELNKMMDIPRSFPRCFCCHFTVAFRSSREMLTGWQHCNKASFPIVMTTVVGVRATGMAFQEERFQELDMKPAQEVWVGKEQ